ncbi:MAG: protein translocase subunit SecF [Anaerolinea sp.]|nr:protein translocase subunit SecF [Anaerolinea sp.]
MNIIKRRYLFFLISLLIIIPGILALIFWGLPLAIDFTGGSMLEVQFPAGKALSTTEVIEVYNQLGISDPWVQSSDNDILVIRSIQIEETTKTAIVTAMADKSGTVPTILRFDTVGPSIGKEVAARAAGAVAAAALAILIYITFAFRGVPHAFRFGAAAIIAMVHDILVIVGIEAILCYYLGWEVDSLFLTALLTVIGFSVHDTIVVFDRIRENSNIYRKLPFETVVNHSIVQTMDRSINTSLTVMLTLLALTLFGGTTIRHFVLILLIGVFSGTYSSIFNASPILVVWENQEWKTWFKRKHPASI